MVTNFKPSGDPQNDVICKCSIDIFSYLIICWSIGFFWGCLGKFTASNIGTGRRIDDPMIVLATRSET